MRKALVIGIDEYPSNPLAGCVNDANAVSELLEENGDGSQNFTVRKKMNYLTKGTLKGLISDLFSGRNDIVLLYFSGHGVLDGKSSYLVTSDFTRNDYGVSMDEVMAIANASDSANKVIILDCCHSGSLGSPGLLGGSVAFIGDGTTLLTASRSDEVSREVLGHGVFTNLLLDALSGGAADLSGNITPGSVYSYIDQALGPWDQRPMFKTNVSQFLTLRTIPPAIERSVLRRISAYFPDPKKVFALDPSYEYTNSPDVEARRIEPYADEAHIAIFKDLQKFASAGLVEPVGVDYMYFAAMESKSCRLTPLGWHYWRLIKDRRI